MRNRRLPIRSKLTIWYAGLFAGAFIVFAIALYLGLRYFLYTSFEEQVRSQAHLAITGVQIENGRPVLDPSIVAQLDDDEHFVRLYSVSGQLITDSRPDLRATPLAPENLARLTGGRTLLSSQRGLHDGTFIMVSAPIFDNGSVVGVLQTGASREDSDEALRLLALALFIAVPLMLLVAGIAGYVLAGRALEPVARITSLADSIGGNDLSARLKLDLPDDELGRLASTFDAMLARIEDAFERQRRFTGDAAHELRTPLSLMRSEVDLALARPRSPEEYRESLTEFDRDLQRLTGLVGTLLALARSDSGQLKLERSPVELADLVQVIADQYAESAEVAQIRLSAQANRARAMVDEDLLIQVLVNLVDNALTHTPIGGEITIASRADGGWVELEVRDTGSGIAPQHLGRIFDRFYRVDEGRARTYGGGNGLGLSISRAIVEAHGGTISVTSEVGTGTRVTVRLPSG